MSAGIACGRLAEERKGFVARPETSPDGSFNLMVWHCIIPGKQGTDWEGGHFPFALYFSEEVQVPSGLLSPKCVPFWNCVLINSERDYVGSRPAITVKLILVGMQDLLVQPNPADPAQTEGYHLFVEDPLEYKRLVQQQAGMYPSLV